MSSDFKLDVLSNNQLRDRIANQPVDYKKNIKTEKENSVGKSQEQAFDAELKNSLEKKEIQGSTQKAENSEGLKFSAHAQSRLTSRGIELTPNEIVRMQEAIQKMDAKGSKESLILTDKAAFVVSVKNNTVITAVDKDSLKENIFTNIDSTIMI